MALVLTHELVEKLRDCNGTELDYESKHLRFIVDKFNKYMVDGYDTRQLARNLCGILNYYHAHFVGYAEVFGVLHFAYDDIWILDDRLDKSVSVYSPSAFNLHVKCLLDIGTIDGKTIKVDAIPTVLGFTKPAVNSTRETTEPDIQPTQAMSKLRYPDYRTW